MIKTEILIIYTALILIAALMPLNYMIRNTIIKKYNEYIKISDYKNALDLLENIKFGLSKWEQKLLLINLYFTTNNFEKYKYTKHNYRLIKSDKFPDLELQQIYNIKIIDNIFMYLHEEIEKANNAFLLLHMVKQ